MVRCALMTLMTSSLRSLNCIMPPHILQKLLESEDRDIYEAAMSTLLSTAHLRGARAVRASFVGAVATPAGGRRTIFDCQHRTFLPSAVLARSEEGAESADKSANQAFDGLGTTRQFYKDVYGRNSIDDRGMRLDGYVHRGKNYNNAFWNGREMIFGDGDGRIFTDFTGSLDVIGHELTHGVTEHTAGLEYRIQSGALNEHISDVFGSLIKQWSLRQSAMEADWLIGSEIFTPDVDADALRSMKAPGTAYDNKIFGQDPQPDHMSEFVHLPDTERGDNGGVHINSGIPNKAFYLVSVGIGGFAWEAPGHIWYESLKASNPQTQFQDFADTTYAKAEELYGADSAEQEAVLAAWREVGLQISGVPTAAGVRTRRISADSNASAGGAGGEADGLAAFTRQISALSAQIQALTKEVRALQTTGK